jgi:thiopurine S-methyltransferase
MQHEFWNQRWQQNQIGFHKQEVNSHLLQQWPELAVEPNSRVFVPMCGKSNDMLWWRCRTACAWIMCLVCLLY